MIRFIVINDGDGAETTIQSLRNNPKVDAYGCEIWVTTEESTDNIIHISDSYNYICVIEPGAYVNTVMLEDIFNQIESHDLYILPFLHRNEEGAYKIGNFLKKDERLDLANMSTEHMSFIFHKSIIVNGSVEVKYDNIEQFCKKVYSMSKNPSYIHDIDWFCHTKDKRWL